MTHPKNCVNYLIMRPDPGDEGKCAKTCPQVVRKPKNDKSEDGKVREELVAAKSPTVGSSTTLGFVKGAEKYCGGESGRPYQGSRINQPSASLSSKTKPVDICLDHDRE